MMIMMIEMMMMRMMMIEMSGVVYNDRDHRDDRYDLECGDHRDDRDDRQ